ncbi:MAG: glycosyltransferase family 4 protein [Bacteroidales bacterium]|nr:glycosyltransferase family 4 protein [Bacteroidales bacterium]
MKIGFDAKRAFYNKSGLGNYSRDLIKALHLYDPSQQYYLYTPSVKGAISFIHNSDIRIKTPDKNFGKLCQAYWRSFLLTDRLKKDGIDLFHGLSNELPVNIHKKGIKSVVTIHDLIFMRFPQWYSTIDRYIYTRKFRYSGKVAKRVITVSEQTKNDLIEFFQIDENKIKVIYQGCNESFKKKLSGNDHRKIVDLYKLPSQFILYVGTIEERKNLLNIIKSIHLGQINIPLVVVGRPTRYLRKVREFISENKVRNIIFMNQLPVEHLPAIYQLAEIFIYPSVFEGFGIPILEAMTSGIPVVTSTGSCFKEVGGKAAYYIDPYNTDEMICAIKSVLSENDRREEMIKKGYEQAEKFNNSDIAAKVMNAYREISDE